MVKKSLTSSAHSKSCKKTTKVKQLALSTKRSRKQPICTSSLSSASSLRRLRASRVLRPRNHSIGRVKVASARSRSRSNSRQQEPQPIQSEVPACCGAHNKQDCTKCQSSNKSPMYLLSGGAAANHALAQRLPKTLMRPVFPEAAPADLAYAANNSELLAWTPMDVRKELLLDSRHLLYAFMNTRIAPINALRTSQLPKSVNIHIPEGTSSQHLTTHILAVHSVGRPQPLPHPVSPVATKGRIPHTPANTYIPAPVTGARKVTLYPIHGLLLSAHCARIPPLPRYSDESAATDPIAPLPSYDTSGKICEVPLVPFGVPAAECFGILLQYLYTQDAPALLRNILPFWHGADVPRPISVVPRNQSLSGPLEQTDYEFSPSDQARIAALSKELSERLTGASLVSLAMRIHGLWQNACSLGIRGDDVWDVVSVAWRTVLGALAIEKH